jgi:hypothetical protein
LAKVVLAGGGHQTVPLIGAQEKQELKTEERQKQAAHFHVAKCHP